MNANELLKQAKEVNKKFDKYMHKRIKTLKDFYYYECLANSEEIKAKELLTSIQEGKIEGCEHFIENTFRVCGNKSHGLMCPSCQSKINEAKAILQEILK